jgi:hypothetical protein
MVKMAGASLISVLFAFAIGLIEVRKVKLLFQ